MLAQRAWNFSIYFLAQKNARKAQKGSDFNTGN